MLNSEKKEGRQLHVDGPEVNRSPRSYLAKQVLSTPKSDLETDLFWILIILSSTPLSSSDRYLLWHRFDRKFRDLLDLRHNIIKGQNNGSFEKFSDFQNCCRFHGPT